MLSWRRWARRRGEPPDGLDGAGGELPGGGGTPAARQARGRRVSPGAHTAAEHTAAEHTAAEHTAAEHTAAEHTAAEHTEWLEADGLGGFASGTTLGLNTRRYHALLLVALEPPAARHVLVNDALVWIELAGKRHALSSQRFAGALPEAPVTRLAPGSL